jgi:hypothetical protein
VERVNKTIISWYKGDIKNMSYVQVGSCPQCGAPIYQPSTWMGILPPPSTHSCNCQPRQQSYTNNKIYVYDDIPEPSKVKTFNTKNPKIEIIKALKKYKKDTTTKAEEAAFEAVIEWFINCTPDYQGDENKNT